MGIQLHLCLWSIIFHDFAFFWQINNKIQKTFFTSLHMSNEIDSKLINSCLCRRKLTAEGKGGVNMPPPEILRATCPSCRNMSSFCALY